ncbi:MAG: putative inorganic carbon transporter subunit DabA, partial [Nitrospiraceae bacterium]
YLAIRLFYERELVGQGCREELGIEGTFEAIRSYMESHPLAYQLRQERVAGRLPGPWSRRVDRLRNRWPTRGIEAWEALAGRYLTDSADWHRRAACRSAAWRLLALAKALGIAPAELLNSPATDLKTLLDWLDAFPETQHGPRWLEAFEAGYQESLFAQVVGTVGKLGALAQHAPDQDVRPQVQAVFCIDVRSEPLRRHLEAIGDYATFGFAGFFICFIRYRALGSHHDTDQFPVIMKARNLVREIPRSYHGDMLSRHRTGARLVRAGHTLLLDLKEHVITPYVMVESLGWFYCLPFVGKTLFPVWYRKLSGWLRRIVAPPVSTALTVDKLSKSEAEEMVATEQRAAIRQALRERLGLHGSQVSPELVEVLRRRALNGEESAEPFKNGSVRLADLSAEEVTAFIEDLRRHYQIDQRWASVQKERITRTGFTLDEQIFTVETALRMMG